MVKRSDIVRMHDKQATEYDQQAREYKWFGPHSTECGFTSMTTLSVLATV